MTKRLSLAILAGCGAMIALYLTLYQANVTGTVWEPFFAGGSSKILDSSLARSIPIPDALLGMTAYLLEILLGLAGGDDRRHETPWRTVAFGVVVAGMAVGSIGLVLLQALYYQAFCTLCLGSAGISFTIAGLAHDQLWFSLNYLRNR